MINFFFLSFFITTLAFAAGHQEIKLTNHIPKSALLYPIGPMNPDQRLELAIGLPPRNQAQLDQLLHNLYEPGSSEYKHWLTPQEYAQRFGTNQADYNAAVDFFKNQGFKVTTSSNRLLLDIYGTVKIIESTFHITIQLYKHPSEKRNFYVPDGNPSVDLNIPLSSIAGLENYTRPCPAWGCGGQHFRRILPVESK